MKGPQPTEIDDTDRTSLIRLYRQTISNLEQILLNQQAAEGYREAGDLARPAIEMILARIESLLPHPHPSLP